MKLIKPLIDYFPPGYTPRPQQEHGLLKIEEAIKKGAKYIIVQAPTGSGKSFISKTLGNAVSECSPEYKRLVFNYHAYDEDYAGAIAKLPVHGCFALTTTKALQNQYKTLFNESVIFKGKSNYQCDVDDEYTVDFAPCVISPGLKKSCWDEHRCPYYESRNDAFIEKFTVLNYASFFNMPQHLKKRQIIVADECSELEDEIVKFYSASIEYRRLTQVGVAFDKLTTEDPAKALGWLVDTSENIKDAIEEHSGRSRFENNKAEQIKQAFRRELYEAVTTIINNWSNTQYVIEKDAEKAIFMPLKIDQLSGCLFNYADTIILMSATIVDKNAYAKTLGIKEFEYIEFESTFDPKKSPIYCHTKFPLSYKTMEKFLPSVVDLAKTLVDSHAGEKGIIHTHSFVITQALQKKLSGRRFLYREEGSTNENIVFEHSQRKDDTVLVSPSLTMGLDLAGDLGKFQIIIKLPFPGLGGKRVKRMADAQPGWLQMKMLVASAKTIVDNKHILPKHFLDRIV
jgi:ATP-dependent DNA helicase DinG